MRCIAFHPELAGVLHLAQRRQCRCRMLPMHEPLLTQVWRLPRHALIAVVRAYRLLLSPSLGSACRFAPTCSVYALQALEQHGALAGSYLAAHRIVRCNPWCQGGCDPVPSEMPHMRRLFGALVSKSSDQTRT